MRKADSSLLRVSRNKPRAREDNENKHGWREQSRDVIRYHQGMNSTYSGGRDIRKHNTKEWEREEQRTEKTNNNYNFHMMLQSMWPFHLCLSVTREISIMQLISGTARKTKACCHGCLLFPWRQLFPSHSRAVSLHHAVIIVILFYAGKWKRLINGSGGNRQEGFAKQPRAVETQEHNTLMPPSDGLW